MVIHEDKDHSKKRMFSVSVDVYAERLGLLQRLGLCKEDLLRRCSALGMLCFSDTGET